MPRPETSAAGFLPERWTMRSLPAAARSCRGCDLWRNATQAVFGEGLMRARLVLVGEMPGNDEDLAGQREELMRALVADLRKVAKVLSGG